MKKQFYRRKIKTKKLMKKYYLNVQLKLNDNEKSHFKLWKNKQKKMKTISNKNFSVALIGQTVRVKIPDFDRCRIDSRILLSVVVEIIDEEFYRLGSKAGTLNQLFTRNQFT